MKTLLPWVLLLAVVLAWTLHEATPPAEAQPPASDDWAVYEMDALRADRSASGRPWLPFLQQPTLSTGLYVLAAGSTDRQQPHDQDEVYYVLAGQATAQVGEDTMPVQPGTVLFVKAGAQHQFLEITEDLELLVFFSAAKPDAGEGEGE